MRTNNGENVAEPIMEIRKVGQSKTNTKSAKLRDWARSQAPKISKIVQKWAFLVKKESGT